MLRPKIGFEEFEIFALREDQVLDVPPPRKEIQIASPDVIYNSAGGAISEDFSYKEPPTTGIPHLFLQTPDPIFYGCGVKMGSVYKKEIEQGKAPTSTPGRNFLDIFFDWLNKILGSR